MKKPGRLLLLFFFFTCGGIAKSPVPIISLEEMVFLALSHNPDIYGGKLDQVVEKYNLASAYYAFQPQYSIDASTRHTETIAARNRTQSNNASLTPKVKLKTLLGTNFTLEMANNLTTHYNPKISLTISQPLLKGAGIDINRFELLNAEDQRLITALALKRTMTSTITEIIKAYRQIVSSYNKLEIDRLSLANRRAELANMRLEIKAGRKARTSVLEIETNIASQELQIAQQENSLQQAKVSLLNKVGLNPNILYTVDKTITTESIEIPPLDEVINIAIKNNIDYQTDWLRIKSVDRQLQKTKNDNLWDLNFTSTLTTGGGTAGGNNAGLESLYNGNNRSSSFGLTLNIPIGDVNKEKNLVSRTVALEKATIQLEQKKRTLETDVMNKVKDIQFQMEQIKLTEKDREIKKQLLDTKIMQQEHGLITLFELESDRTKLINSEQSLVTAKINYLNAITDLENTLGITLESWNIVFNMN